MKLVISAIISLLGFVGVMSPLSAQVAKETFLVRNPGQVRTAQASGTIMGGKNFYRVYIEGEAGMGVGLYTAATGPSHPAGQNLNVLFGDGGPGTTFNTLRSLRQGLTKWRVGVAA